jgi:hypothetical protein
MHFFLSNPNKKNPPLVLMATIQQPEVSSDGKIFCVKCRIKQTPLESRSETINFTKKNGKTGVRHCTAGKCSICGTGMKKFVCAPPPPPVNAAEGVTVKKT